MPVQLRLEPPVGFILRQTGAFKRRLQDLMPLWAAFDKTLTAIEQEQFDSHGHGGWAPLADSTVAQKSAHGFPADPLIRTGTLQQSFHALAEGPQQFEWGTDVPYAHWHQDGGSTPGRPPQRKLIDIRVDDRRKLEKEVVTYVNLAAAETWGRI